MPTKKIVDKELQKNYQQIHDSKSFGACSHRLLNYVKLFVQDKNSETVLDYGCGQSVLIDLVQNELNIKGFRYEPSIPKYAELSIERVDFLINTEVLEHVPEDILDNVLEKMALLTDNAYFTIDTELADEILPNGENAHCTVYPGSWWHKKLLQHFPYVKRIYCPLNGCSFITFKPSTTTLLKYYLFLLQEKSIHYSKAVKRRVVNLFK